MLERLLFYAFLTNPKAAEAAVKAAQDPNSARPWAERSPLERLLHVLFVMSPRETVETVGDFEPPTKSQRIAMILRALAREDEEIAEAAFDVLVECDYPAPVKGEDHEDAWRIAIFEEVDHA